MGRDVHEALLSAPIPAPLQAPQFLLKKKSPPRHDHASPRLLPSFLSAAVPGHIPRCSAAQCPIHLARRRRRGKGGMDLRPHPALLSVGRGGLHAAPGVYVVPLLSTSPISELAGYRSSSPSRLWAPATLCFKCFRRMFQVFHLNVANRSWMLHML